MELNNEYYDNEKRKIIEKNRNDENFIRNTVQGSEKLSLIN